MCKFIKSLYNTSIGPTHEENMIKKAEGFEND